MNEVIIRVREWQDQETSNDILYHISADLAALAQEMHKCGKTKEAVLLVREQGTIFEPTLTIESVQY